MRYRDAAHLDLGSFYARNPTQGKVYRFAGYAALVLAANWANDPERIAWLLIAVLVAWLMAWHRVVGALWRGPLVGAALVCAVIRSFYLVTGSTSIQAACSDGQCLLTRVLSGSP